MSRVLYLTMIIIMITACSTLKTDEMLPVVKKVESTNKSIDISVKGGLKGGVVKKRIDNTQMLDIVKYGIRQSGMFTCFAPKGDISLEVNIIAQKYNPENPEVGYDLEVKYRLINRANNKEIFSSTHESRCVKYIRDAIVLNERKRPLPVPYSRMCRSFLMSWF